VSDILKFCRDQIEGLIEALKLTTDKMRGVIEPDMYDENYHRIHKGESLIGEIDRALQSFSVPPVPEPSVSAEMRIEEIRISGCASYIMQIIKDIPQSAVTSSMDWDKYVHHEIVQILKEYAASPKPAATQGGSAIEAARIAVLCIEEMITDDPRDCEVLKHREKIKEYLAQALAAYAEGVTADKQAEIVALEARVKSAREIIINLTANGVPSDAYMDYCVDARRWLEECDDAV
jgi:hypothetical protein